MIIVQQAKSSRILLGLSLLFWAGLGTQCTFEEQSSTGAGNSVESSNSQLAIEEVNSIEPSLLADTREIAQSLAKISQNDFSFQLQFPLLYELLQGDPEALAIVEAFVKKAVGRESFSDEGDFLKLMEERDEQILPIILPYLENMEVEEWSEKYDKLSEELALLGLQMTSAEGIFTGLGPSSLFTQNLKLEKYTPIVKYDAFTDAHTQSMNGEYPFTNLDPYIKMLLLGEQMEREGNARIYYEKVGASFAEALHVLTDIHLITGDGARVGGVNVENYPYMFALESLKKNLSRFEGSRYKEPIQKIANHPSEMTNRPAHLHLLVESWTDSEAEAKGKVEEHLKSGRDIPHFLPVEKGDGSTQYAVIYRFHEDADQAESALKRMQAQNITGEMVFVTCEKNKLYQLGY